MDIWVFASIYMLINTRYMVRATHPECSIVLHLLNKENECNLKMKTAETLAFPPINNKTAGCRMEWDGVSCWPDASQGESISVRCPLPLLKPDSPLVLITRNCTVQGWSKPSLPYYIACYHEGTEEEEDMVKEQKYFATVKLIYSVGYGMSLAALFIAILVFCIFRKLLCTRTYIHLNLFSTFILRSLAVFVKDAVLFADNSLDHCTVSTVKCKVAVSFFQYCVLANFSWLLVEGLYLQTLLVFTFTQKKKLFWVYTVVGWGTPSVTIVIWTLLKCQLNNEGCWDNLDSGLWWIIKTPILLSIFDAVNLSLLTQIQMISNINFLIFMNISRIVVQKTKATDLNQSERPPYKRLVRSTLLLIPLFGVHYVVFALFPEHVGVGPRLYLELVLGSFQGFIVALLYCFLNGEVQNEIQKMIRGCWPKTKHNVINLPTQEYAV